MATAIHGDWDIDYGSIPTDFQENDGEPVSTDSLLRAMGTIMERPEVKSFLGSIKVYDHDALQEGA